MTMPIALRSDFAADDLLNPSWTAVGERTKNDGRQVIDL